MSNKERSIKIIGAGVAGLTAAAELLDRGFHIDVYETSETIGSTSCSRYAGGMLAPWCERENADEMVAELGGEAIDWWARHIPGVETNGSLVVAQPRDVAELNRFSRRTDHFDWIHGEDLASIEPSLVGRFSKALFFKSEGHLNPRDALRDLALYVQANGGAIHLGHDGHSARSADITIDATGFGAHGTLDQLRGVKGEMLIVETNEVSLARPVRMIHPRIPIYIVPRAGNQFMIGATMIESGERGRITARSMIELLSAAYALHPAFGEAEVIEVGCDVRPAFPDNLPRITEQDGVIYLNGLYRHGFLLAPALARMLGDHLIGAAHVPLYHAAATMEAAQ